MTTTTTRQTAGAVIEPLGSRTKATKALLIGAPLLMALARALLVPIENEDWDGVMTSMAAHQGRSDTGWLLAIAASGLLGATAVLLAHRLRLADRSRTATFVTLSTAIGWAATAATCFRGLYLSVAATAPDRTAMVQVQEELQDSAVRIIFLTALVGAVGYVALGIGLARASLVTNRSAILIAIGGAATLITMGGPVTVILVLAALLLTAGQALVAPTNTDPDTTNP